MFAFRFSTLSSSFPVAGAAGRRKRQYWFANLVAVVLVMLATVAPSALAQLTTANVSGTVRDDTGGVMPDVSVTAVNANTGVTRTARTDVSGNYRITSLPAGVYKFRVEKQGFKTENRADVTLAIGDELRLDYTLQVGMLSETVNVSSETMMTQTMNASLGSVIDERRVEDLPLNGRQYTQLALLSPGVTLDGASQSLASSMEQGGTRVSINGSRTYDVIYTLDGLSITDMTFTNLGGYPPLDSIQEFKVVTGLYDVSGGTKSGGEVNAITKSGMNSFHGSAYEFLRNDHLDARNYFDPAQIPPYHQNQFGFSVGGPVSLGKLYKGKNRTFFFGSYEGLRIRQGVSRAFSVPTADMRTGNLSEFGKTIVNPLTGTPFADATIPDNLIDPVAKAVLEFMPLPNLPGIANNLRATGLRSRNDDTFVTRLDHHFSVNDSVFFRFFFADISNLDPFENVSGGVFGVPGFPQTTKTLSRNGEIGFTHIFSPTLVNQFHVGLNYINGGQLRADGNIDYVSQLHIHGVDTSPAQWGFPLFRLNQFSPIGDNAVPFSRAQTQWRLADNLTWSKGRHDLQFGGEVWFLRWMPHSGEANRGRYDFSGAFTGSQFGDFLLGYPSLGLAAIGDTDGDFRSRYYAGYFSDNWRVTPTLTLNLGIRYEYNSPMVSARNRWSNVYFDPVTAQATLIIASSGGQMDTADFLMPLSSIPSAINVMTSEQFGIPRSLVYPDKNNVSPRIGFSWSPFGNTNTVVRGGYGIFYGTRTLGAAIAAAFTPPFVNLVSATTTDLAVHMEDLLSSGAPVFSALPYATDGTTGYVQQWGLDIQRQITPSLLLDMGYVGTKGTHLELYYSNNQAYPGTGSAKARRPNPAVADLFTYGNPVGTSSYNALQVQLRKRFSRGLTFTTNYTWSKSLDLDSSGLEGQSTGGQGPMDARNIPAEWGPSSFDRRHSLTFNAVYELPFGSGRAFSFGSKAANAVIGGWQVSPIFTYYSGYRFTPQESQDLAGMARFGGSQRPNIVGNCNLPRGDRTAAHWFNTAAFVLQTPGTFGNEGRGVCIGPDFIDTDMAVSKEFLVHNERGLQFRAEFFNMFNRSNFGQPDLTLGSTSFGRVTSAKSSRQIQFSLKFTF